MDAIWIIVVTFVGYLVAYHTYGRFLARKVFHLSNEALVPSREFEDGLDYVPTKRGIIFGHHYTSIAGTGPIVGPAIGIIWGWVPALIWVFVGSIVMGAVHDFGSLVISLRNQGKSLSEITARYINPRARTLFFLITFLELLIVIAIFGVVISAIFNMYPGSVIPIWLQIPIAVCLGLAIYKWKRNVTLATMVAIIAMYATIFLGQWIPFEMPSVAGIPATGVWVLVLLAYVFIASTIPVTVLLQPRDYINAWQLFVAMALLIAGVVGATIVVRGGFTVTAPAYNPSPSGAPPMLPFLCVVIACGAISGFHSLVASGTTPKQLRQEGDAQFVGYGSMLMEGVLAVLVIVAVAAGFGMVRDATTGAFTTSAAPWQGHYATWGNVTGGLGAKLKAVIDGSANMISTIGIPKTIATIIMGVFVVSFAGTTLDTATRIQRYVISELGSDFKISQLSNRWIATSIAVITAGALAFATGASGTGAMTLWPMFGAVNQLLAALALLLITLYLKKKNPWSYFLTLIPCLFMLAMTIWAMVWNEMTYLHKGRWLLVGINGMTLLLAIWMVVEAFVVFFTPGCAERQPEGCA